MLMERRATRTAERLVGSRATAGNAALSPVRTALSRERGSKGTSVEAPSLSVGTTKTTSAAEAEEKRVNTADAAAAAAEVAEAAAAAAAEAKEKKKKSMKKKSAKLASRGQGGFDHMLSLLSITLAFVNHARFCQSNHYVRSLPTSHQTPTPFLYIPYRTSSYRIRKRA
jgi:hypothetical protein